MDLSVDRCRRRPTSERLLIYLDTSTFGALARDDDGAGALAAALHEAIDTGTGICAGSPWHDDEASLLRFGQRLDRVVQTIRTYTLDLRMRHWEELIDQELYAAASEFNSDDARITWEEAFEDNPDDPPLKPFQADYLNRLGRLEHPQSLLDEVNEQRRVSELLADVHQELRGADLEWETVAAANLEQQVWYLLGPLADADFLAAAEARQHELVLAWLRGQDDIAPGSSTRLYLRFARIASMATSLRERYPAVARDPQGFAASHAVRYLPVVRLFSFLLAALSVDGRRTTPQASDLHDLWHLTYGLSRCDIVTADRRSVALVQQRDLVPDGAQLLEAHRLDEIAMAVRASVTSS